MKFLKAHRKIKEEGENVNIAIFEVATMVAGVNIAIFGGATVVVGANIAIFGDDSVVKVISSLRMCECNATTGL